MALRISAFESNSSSSSNTSSSSSSITRKIRAHRKTRTGCGNCKMRRVKCDETGPECQRCRDFGVICNYDRTATPSLQPRYGQSADDLTDEEAQLAIRRYHIGEPLQIVFRTVQTADMTTASMIRRSPGPPPASMFSHFSQTNGVTLSRDEPNELLVRAEIQPIQYYQLYQKLEERPYLTHFVQALASVSDRYMSPHAAHRSLSEMHHWTAGLTHFIRKLATPNLPRSEIDSLWGAASLLIPLAWSSVDLAHPEETWPLGQPRDDGPEWIAMGNGKCAIWDICRPDAPNSLFRPFFLWTHTIKRTLATVPPAVVELCGLEGLDETNLLPICNWEESLQGNAYADAALTVFRPVGEDGMPVAVMNMYAINHTLQKAFGRLVAAKDVPALVVMMYFYVQAAGGPWWLARRALVEGQATVMYLERHAAGDARVRELLVEPRRALFGDSVAL